MKRLLSVFFTILCTSLYGQTYPDYMDFKYQIINGNEAQIRRYSGNNSDVIVPENIVKDNVEYKVTSIYTVSGRTKDYICESIYIPKTVTQYITQLTAKEICPRTVVMENGEFSLPTEKKLLQIDNLTNNKFDNLIIFGSCSFSCADLANNGGYLIKPGEIYIYKTDGTFINIQMYLGGYFAEPRKTFGQSRINDLCSALEKHGTSLSSVKAIDLSNLYNNSDITITSLDISAKCPNATIITSKEEIVDKADYTAPTTNYTGTIAYHRENTQYWNSVCLPFAITQSDFPEGTTIYQATRTTAEKVYLSKLENGQMLAAGTPCYIYCENNTPWNLLLNNRTIAANQGAIEVVLGDWKLVGSFTKQTLGEGKYKLNSAGTEFVMTTSTSTVTPFRCYLTPTSTSSGAPSRLEVGIDDEAEITLVPDDRAPQQVKLYDLMGRPRRNNASGIYLRGK